MAERYVVREGPGGTRLAGHSLWREGAVARGDA